MLRRERNQQYRTEGVGDPVFDFHRNGRCQRDLASVEYSLEHDPDNTDQALLILGIAGRDPARKDWDRERVSLLLEPWAVQAALSRRRVGSRLSDKDVAEIRRCTRDANALRWPRGTDE
jgi:hypothetical protein